MYGTITETSDEDLGGIFIPNKDYILGTKRCEQVILSEKLSKTIRNQKGDTDYTLYSLPKFIELAQANNPNILEFLYAPQSCKLIETELGKKLCEQRDLFLSKKAYHTFKGYAYAQRKKLEVKLENLTGRTELVDKHGYDTKFASHLIRLLSEGLQLLTEKALTFPLPNNNLIRDIKLGNYKLSWVLNKAQELEALIDLAYVQSDLQYTADFGSISELQIWMLEEFWKGQNGI
jgi:predicted nucleotidyltransferase